MKKIFVLCLLGISLCGFRTGTAQTYELGLQLGASLYFGDLDAPSFSKNLGNFRPAFGGFVRYNFNDWFSLRGNLTIGKLRGDDARSNRDWQLLRNLNFESNFQEGALLGEIYILNLLNANAERRLNPYIAAGIAVFHFNPQTEYEGQTVDLQPLGTEGQGLPQFPDREKYKLTQIAIPFGAGVKYRLNEKISLGVEIVGRRAFTDYIDDVSDTYVNYFELLAGNGPLAAALGNRQGEFLGQSEPVLLPTGTQRGKVEVDDYYFTTMFTVSFHMEGRGFGRGSGKLGCPTF